MLRAQGSSPLARGTPFSDVPECLSAGLIPARAGNTASRHGGNDSHRAHPRSRGEHSCVVGSETKLTGSSPLARGTRLVVTGLSWSTGLIPARAGNTPTQPHTGREGRAHPRSRGEHRISETQIIVSGGSSPLARGTHGAGHLRARACGLIPARAGNTRARRILSAVIRAHPRSRGEHPTRGRRCSSRAGSSPLARGTPVAVSWTAGLVGLIPARAGNTCRADCVFPGPEAHPRSRGEHAPSCPPEMWTPGSSPLARGTRHASRFWRLCSGLIPARAGNTGLLSQRRCRLGAHPRSRGEHRVQRLSSFAFLGSSPLARGTRIDDDR